MTASTLNIWIAEVFGQGKDLDEAAAGWIKHWESHETEAMCALINFIIRCTGCTTQVDIHDIEDADNAVNKLSDIQEAYEAQKPVEYPLISKAKSHAAFRTTLVEFIETFIAACNTAGLLNSNLAIMENLEIWLSPMSSSSLRPFRHTIAVIALSLNNSICKVAAGIAENIAKTSRQKESEQKKKRVNEGRIKDLEKTLAELEHKLTQDKDMIQAWFDVVFVHRYRDVDPKIRLECVAALGTWILTLPDVFFEGMYLRYLGWMLSDSAASTRAEVVKQLLRMYKNKDNVARLRTFTERFRTRILEMAQQDADLNIRVLAIELLELIRETELLEPDDVDNIGKLIFDSEPRIRKAVSGFFSENINDLYEATLDEFGGQESFLEIFGDDEDEDLANPRPSWLKLKCMAETLRSYDAGDDEAGSDRRDLTNSTSTADSRLSLAAQNIYEVMPEAKEWEIIAGYLLYDFSQAGGATDTANATFLARCELNESEQVFLLELLDVAVKGRFQEASEGEIDRKGRRTAKQKEELHRAQESMALSLAETIPKLLKKFGSNAVTAAPVLALGSIISLEIFEEIQQESPIFGSLLDDFTKQFLSHGEREVLVEATNTFLHAQEYDDLSEVTEVKIQGLWGDLIRQLRAAVESSIGEHLSDLSDTIKRIAILANVISCVDVFQSRGQAKSKRKSATTAVGSPLSLLIALLQEPVLDQEAGEDAVEILVDTMNAVRSYYMWATVNHEAQKDKTAPLPPTNDLPTFTRALTSLAASWPATSRVRQTACACILDVHTLFARFRTSPNIQSEIPSIPSDAQPLILQTFIALEKQFARLARKKLESGPVDGDPQSDPEDPVDSDDEDSDDEDEGEPSGSSNRTIRTLLTERSLCRLTYSIMLAVLAKAFDPSSGNQIRLRVQRNRLKLGGAFKETIAQMDDAPAGAAKGGARKPKAVVAPSAAQQPTATTNTTAAAVSAAAKSTGKATGGIATAANGGKGAKKSAATVRDEDEERDEDEDGNEAEEGGEEDLRARELMEDRIDDDDDDDDENDGDEEQGQGQGQLEAGAEAEDEIMGD